MRLADVQDLLRRAGLDELVSTLRVRWRGSLIWLHSLPSEKVPAPPSPNCTFDSGSSTPRRHRPQVSRVRSRTALPRSSTIGRRPICASTQRGEDAAGAEADHHRPRRVRWLEVGRRLRDEAVARVGRRPEVRIARVAREHVGLVGHLAVDRVDQHQRRLSARIDRAAEHGERHEPRVAHAQPLDDRSAQRGIVMVERKSQFCNAEHVEVQRGRTSNTQASTEKLTKAMTVELMITRVIRPLSAP